MNPRDRKTGAIAAVITWLVCGSPLVVPSRAAEREAAKVPPPPAVEGDCERDEHTLLLNGQTVLRNVRWRIGRGNPDGSDRVGCGIAVAHRESTGHFWFFGSENIELTCKALDGRALTAAYWVFCGALTNVEWWMDAINNANPGIQKRYYNAPGKMASFGDVAALPGGSNTSPFFVEAADCGRTFVVSRQGSFSIAFTVKDTEGDSLTASVRGLKGEVIILPPEWNGDPYPPNGLKLYPRWKGQVPGSGATLLTSFYTPDQPGEFAFAFEVTDGKSLLPTRCTVGLFVPFDP